MTVSSGDPTFFGASLTDELWLCMTAFGCAAGSSPAWQPGAGGVLATARGQAFAERVRSGWAPSPPWGGARDPRRAGRYRRVLAPPAALL